MLRANGWPGLRSISGSAALGLAAATGQAPLGWWFVALPALALLIRQLAAAQPRAAIWRAWFAGAGYFAATLNWIVQPFMVDAARDGWMAPFALVLIAFGMALFWALAAAVLPLTRHRAFGFALALTATELLRGYVLTGFPWAQIGHIWIDTPAALLAALAGPSGLTLLSLIAAALLAQWRVLPVLSAVALIGGAWAYGLWALAQPMPADRAVTLRLVQPNAAQHVKWDPDLANQFFDVLLRFTNAYPPPDLVIWPETALPYLIDRHSELPAMIAQAGNGATVILGRQRLSGDRAFNTLTAIAPDGRILADYDKHHLVPFGEYIPFGDLLFDWLNIGAFAAVLGNGYSAGPGPQLIDLGPKLGKVLPLICYEAVFPQDLRGVDRADWILQITNDAWFGVWTGPFQHAAQARLRAIEQGLPLLRVANTGVTAVYDARGRQLAALEFDTAAYLNTALPAALPITPYARLGEIPVLLLLACAGLLLMFRRRRSSP